MDDRACRGANALTRFFSLLRPRSAPNAGLCVPAMSTEQFGGTLLPVVDQALCLCKQEGFESATDLADGQSHGQGLEDFIMEGQELEVESAVPVTSRACSHPTAPTS